MSVDRHPFVRATLTLAVRDLLRYKHRHESWPQMAQCPSCVARFWMALGKAAPVKIMQQV